MIVRVLPMIMPDDMIVRYMNPPYRYFNSNWGKPSSDKVNYMFLNEHSKQMCNSHKIH